MASKNDDDQVVFFSATGPVFAFQKNDKFAKRLAQGILVSLKLASVTEVSKDPWTKPNDGIEKF